MIGYSPNPYFGLSFFEFFWMLFKRMYGFLSGNIPFAAVTSDELQMTVLCCVALSSALVGSFLVLRRMTMLANALSHTILLGIVAAYVITEPGGPLNILLFLGAAIIVSFITTFLTEFLTHVIGLQADASIGLTFTSLFALGIVLVTALTRNAHIGAEVVMGNVDALQVNDLILAASMAFVNVVLIATFFKEYSITTFDGSLATVLGISTVGFNYLLMSQVSLTVVSAFRAVGVLMVLSMLTGPALTARLICNSLPRMVFVACVIGMGSSLVGVAISRHLLSVYGLSFSTAGITVCTITAIFAIVVLIQEVRKRTLGTLRTIRTLRT